MWDPDEQSILSGERCSQRDSPLLAALLNILMSCIYWWQLVSPIIRVQGSSVPLELAKMTFRMVVTKLPRYNSQAPHSMCSKHKAEVGNIAQHCDFVQPCNWLCDPV